MMKKEVDIKFVENLNPMKMGFCIPGQGVIVNLKRKPTNFNATKKNTLNTIKK